MPTCLPLPATEVRWHFFTFTLDRGTKERATFLQTVNQTKPLGAPADAPLEVPRRRWSVKSLKAAGSGAKRTRICSSQFGNCTARGRRVILALRGLSGEDAAAVENPRPDEQPSLLRGAMLQIFGPPEDVEDSLWLARSEFTWPHEPAGPNGARRHPRPGGSSAKCCGEVRDAEGNCY